MNNTIRLMSEVGEMMRKNELSPIKPMKTFDISELETALLSFSRGEHMGKIVVSYQNDQSVVKVSENSTFALKLSVSRDTDCFKDGSTKAGRAIRSLRPLHSSRRLGWIWPWYPPVDDLSWR